MTPEQSIETTGENVEQAIAKGLAELGVGPSEVIVEVLDEPSKGVFGIGARPARVRLQLLGGRKPAPPPPPAPPVTPEPAPPVAEMPAPEPRPAPPRPRREASRPPRRPPEREPEAAPETAFEIDVPEDEEADAESLFADMEEIVSERDVDEEAAVGKVVLGELLERMSIRADIIVRRARAEQPEESAPFVLDITGGELNRLIGRRGETLASLQYIARLITSRELQRRANIIVDVNGYKARRAKMLQGLALRMAAQAVERGRTVTLEPMPPHERRIIHLALRDSEEVSTRSIGEGAGRKVTIVPKNPSA